MTTFSADIPPNCPLPAAALCDAIVFRACHAAPPSANDFQTHAELGLAPNAVGPAACKRFGISVFPKKTDCEHMLEVFPSNGNHVAMGTLTPVHGKIADTPSNRFPTHMTWWPFEGVNRAEPFV